MVSVIVAAHNEEAVIGDCLDALQAEARAVPLEIIVSANGCTDATAEIARSREATVVDRPAAGKPGALNAAEEIAISFPRIYLDADIIVPPGAIKALTIALDDTTGVLAAMPARRMNTQGRPWPVRAYYRINERLPVFHSGLFGRGLIAVSERGRRRFGTFPEMVADDLFLDAQFATSEKSELSSIHVTVEAPYTTRDLVRRLTRVRRGNTDMRRVLAEQGVDLNVRPSDRWAWLRDVVARDLRLLPDAVPYLAVTLLAAHGARRSRGAIGDWGRDDTTRVGRQPEGSVSS